MGACASVPKSMKGEFAAAPPPEPLKEETSATTTTTEVPEIIKVTEKDVVVDGSHESTKDEKEDDGLPLGPSIDKDETVKEKTDVETKTVVSETVKAEMQESEALPVSDNPTGESDLDYIAPVARVTTEDDKDIEVKEEIKTKVL